MEIKLQEIDKNRWLIPRTGNMRVPGIIFSNHELIKAVQEDQSLLQVANVATLPGIVKHSLAMPDIHWGYGFPIGGVAAFNMKDGIVSPGGVGYDTDPTYQSLISLNVENQMYGINSTCYIRIPFDLDSNPEDLDFMTLMDSIPLV